MKLLSFVMPAYNEEATISHIIKKVFEIDLPEKYQRELIVVNDCSKDRTEEIVKKISQKEKRIKLISNKVNLGKSQSVRRGIIETKGDFVVIQDADLEYDPNDIADMLDMALKKELDVVYGDRFAGRNGVLYATFYLGNKIVTGVSNIFTFPRVRKIIPDMETCYKLVRGEIFREVGSSITSKSTFGLEPEVTAKLARYKKGGRKLRWGIMPISYFPRTIEEGKKIRYTDGLKAIVEIVKFNLFG
jgi:glycosyltransferase involved in cell wall biosynthesis